MDFTGKTAVVTGGSRGIGRAVCLELAKGGANVVLCYAGNEAAAAETVSACEALGAKALAVKCDVADGEQVKALMDEAVKAFGRIDILVNNAGITRDGLLMMMKEADFDAVISANLRGTFLCMKAVARQMVLRISSGCPFCRRSAHSLSKSDCGMVVCATTSAGQSSSSALTSSSLPIARPRPRAQPRMPCTSG